MKDLIWFTFVSICFVAIGKKFYDFAELTTCPPTFYFIMIMCGVFAIASLILGVAYYERRKDYE